MGSNSTRCRGLTTLGSDFNETGEGADEDEDEEEATDEGEGAG
jgi:hypothetical protein